MKRKKHESPRNNTSLLFILLLVVPIYGGYYPFAFLFCGAVMFLLLLRTHQKGVLRIPVSLDAICLYVLGLCYLLSVPFSINCGMAFVGFLRSLVWILFYLLANGYTQEERERMLNAAAWEGVALSLLFTLLFLGERALGFQDLNGRIDGPFQYANTWGLFQLLCLILLLYRKKPARAEWIAGAVLLCGILLTGSRGVLLLLPLPAIWLLFTRLREDANPAGDREKRHVLFRGVLLCAVVFASAYVLSGGLLLKRILSIPSSSAMFGRLLYASDGIRMILKHPLGVGLGGYYYLQLLEQHGVYTLRQIHNEYLQAALDGGILAGILLLVFMAALLCSRGRSQRERIVIFAAMFHAFLDFDFQFSAVVFLVILCGAGETKRSLQIPARPLCARVLGGVSIFLTVCMLYLSAAFLIDFTGRDAWALFPANLEFAEKHLQAYASATEAEAFAREILHRTDLSLPAWDCVYQAAALRKDSRGMVEAKYHYLRLNRYEGSVYEDFVGLLEEASEGCAAEDLAEYQRLAGEVLKQLKEVEGQTSPLAYRIAEKPDLDFMEPVSSRLRRIMEKGVKIT